MTVVRWAKRMVGETEKEQGLASSGSLAGVLDDWFGSDAHVKFATDRPAMEQPEVWRSVIGRFWDGSVSRG